MSQNQFKTQQSLLDWLSALWRFSRPHTIFGTTFSVVSLFLIALAATEAPFARAGFSAPADLLHLLGALVACLAGNIYIVGLNQLEDIAIDQINKPHLPVASGEFSRGIGGWIVAVTGTLALLLGILQGPWLLATVGISLGIGTAYSLPPIRLKRFPFWAALCIFTVRGVIVNLGLFLHFDQQMGRAGAIPPQIWALTLFILGFTFAIAIFKDMPDLEGDRQYNITTLTLQLGTPAVFNLGRWVLTLCYGGMAIASFLGLPMVNQVVVITTHLVALGALWWRSLRVNLHHKSEIASFYQFVWKLFFLEYFLFTAACLLA